MHEAVKTVVARCPGVRPSERVAVVADTGTRAIGQALARAVAEDGELTVAQGPQGEQMLAMLRDAGPGGANLAELGIGTNERARLTGNILEDEKILGTVHVAFGASAAIGGTVAVPIHLDAVVMEATLTVDGVEVLRRGRFVGPER